MDELLELLPVPAERDMPPGHLEQRTARLLEVVEADLHSGAVRAGRLRRLRGLRVWLLSLGAILVVLVCVGLGGVQGSGSRPESQAVLEAAAMAVGGPAAVSLAVTVGSRRQVADVRDSRNTGPSAHLPPGVLRPWLRW